MFFPQVPQITVLLFKLQELYKETGISSTNQSSSFLMQVLFKETGSALDVPSMAGSSRTGFWMRLTIVEPGWCLSLFFAIGCFRTSWYFPPNHMWLWYFSLLCKFWLPLNSHSVLHFYCSIKALVQYQILLKEVMLNQKVVCYSWLMMKTLCI